MYSYCLDNLKENGIFYVQGMTDLLAPLLVITDDGMYALKSYVCMYACSYVAIYRIFFLIAVYILI